MPAPPLWPGVEGAGAGHETRGGPFPSQTCPPAPSIREGLERLHAAGEPPGLCYCRLAVVRVLGLFFSASGTASRKRGGTPVEWADDAARGGAAVGGSGCDIGGEGHGDGECAGAVDGVSFFDGGIGE